MLLCVMNDGSSAAQEARHGADLRKHDSLGASRYSWGSELNLKDELHKQHPADCPIGPVTLPKVSRFDPLHKYPARADVLAEFLLSVIGQALTLMGVLMSWK